MIPRFFNDASQVGTRTSAWSTTPWRVSFAGVIEHVGWTNGSTHNQMLQHRQSWIAVHNVDVAAVVLLLLLAVLATFTYGIMLIAKYVSWMLHFSASFKKQQ